MKTIGKYFYVTILILLFISLSDTAQGKSYSDLQVELSQWESWLQTRERAERIWREGVNSRDVVFLPAPLPIIGNVPIFMDKETLGTVIAIQVAERGLSKERRDSLLTRIADFDEALREEMRNRYLPWLINQIKKDREEISRIRTEMADLKEDGPDIYGLIGKWEFGRVNGDSLGTLDLTETKGQFGYVIHGRHPNESYWKLEGNELVFMHKDGQVTSRLTRKRKNYWEGPYYKHPDVPFEGIVHYIKR